MNMLLTVLGLSTLVASPCSTVPFCQPAGYEQICQVVEAGTQNMSEMEFIKLHFPNYEVVVPNTPTEVISRPGIIEDKIPGQNNTGINAGTADQSEFAHQVVKLVNEERSKNGLSPLKVSGAVQSAAQVRTKEQAQRFSHTRPNGTSYSTALTEAGVSYRSAGENIAYGYRTPEEVMKMWMNSSGHRANILNGSYTTIGVGYEVINGTSYWVQLFTN